MEEKNLLAAVREDFAGVRMHTGPETIMADGHRRRNRHRAYGAGVAAVAVAAVAISGVTLASGSAATGTHEELTAWTVQKGSNGTIDVTIHDLTDLTALDQKLAAAGAPSEVISQAHYPAACVDQQAMKADMSSVITDGPEVPGGFAFVIHPAGIPSGTKLLLDVITLHPTAHGTSGGVGDKLWGFGDDMIGNGVAAAMGLVHGTAGC